MEIIERITLEEIRKAKPVMIFYAANTCWWTHDPAHLGTLPGKHPLPCDPRGSVLFQTDDIEGFLKAAENNLTHYGKHGLRAFMAAHHLNCVVSLSDQRATSAEGWDEYNDALDRLDRRGKGKKDV